MPRYEVRRRERQLLYFGEVVVRVLIQLHDTNFLEW